MERAQIPLCFALSARCLPQGRGAAAALRRGGAAASPSARGAGGCILGQILYQLGRWIYLIDAADDLKKDTESGNYNPLLYRYHTENGVLGEADRLALAETLDASIERMASAYALYDYGVWTPILDSIFYESLYGIGKAVLDGTYRRRTRTRYGERKKKSNEEAL